jgi:uroporphyrinogen decarboxylase
MSFAPDYRHIVDVACNRLPARLPLYEHLTDACHYERVLGREFGPTFDDGDAGKREFYRSCCEAIIQLGYDTISFESCVVRALPNAGALGGGGKGPIQSRADFNRYPWDSLVERFFAFATAEFDAVTSVLPAGMKIVGGVGNGPFEISEDLVGFESLCYMQADDPELFADLYTKIGDLHCELWQIVLERWGEHIAVPRFGDDMGFKTGTLLAPQSLLDHLVPQYQRILKIIRGADKPFLWHSCGKIFPLMEAMIEVGITAKHSNEDAIADLDEWIARYGDRIGLFGGIDTDRVCRMAPDDLYAFTLDAARRYRGAAKGYALGSGNSIPAYVPTEGYLAMVRAAHTLRDEEA